MDSQEPTPWQPPSASEPATAKQPQPATWSPAFRPVPTIPLGGVAPPTPDPITTPWWSGPRAPLILLLAAALWLEISSFLRWVSVNGTDGVGRTGGGWRNINGNLSWGPFFAVLALAIVGLTVAAVMEFHRDRCIRLAIGCGVFAIVGSLAQFIDISTAPREMNASAEYGLYSLLLAAGFCVLCGSVALAISRRESRESLVRHRSLP